MKLTGFVFVAMVGSCVPLRDPGVVGPGGDTDLTATASASSSAVFVGSTVTLTAGADGGTPPYSFRWDVNAAPAEVTLDDPTGSTVTTSTLESPGRHVFRVVVTDGDGSHAQDFAVVEVSQGVEVTAPPLAVVGEAVELRAEASELSTGTTFLWEITRGTAGLSDPTAAQTSLTAAAAETVVARLTVTLQQETGEPVTTQTDVEVAAVADLAPRVLIETNHGDITLELDGEAAPRHTANLLLYVDDGFYNGLVFHRAVCRTPAGGGECQPFVIQAGGYRRGDGELVEVEPTRDAVASEADNGLSNGIPYTVALALSGGDPDSGTTQFFVNLDPDNDSLDDQGFTVFGRVANGRAVVDEIARVPTQESSILDGEVSLPLQDVIIQRMTRLSRDE